jgi:hypothetical protein
MEILAQFGLSQTRDDDKRNGFNAYVFSSRGFANLTDAWRKLIESRRADEPR